MSRYLSTIALSAFALISGNAFAHTSFVVNATAVAYAGKSYTATLNVGHGCENASGTKFDTDRLEVAIPSTVIGVRPMDATWGTATVVKNADGLITTLVWTKPATARRSEDSHLYQAMFKGTLPNTPFTTLAFPATQYCHDDQGNEIMTEWKDANAPTLKLMPARVAGWNKYTAQTAMDEVIIKSFFADALIVWSGGAAYSANPAINSLITDKLTTLSSGAEYWVKY